eukprot:COSAG02_NODE_144_length_34086_cov_65.390944_36_plen_77_part_00
MNGEMNGAKKVSAADILFPPCDPSNRIHRLSGGETNPTVYGRTFGSRGLLRYRPCLGGALSQVTSHSTVPVMLLYS